MNRNRFFYIVLILAGGLLAACGGSSSSGGGSGSGGDDNGNPPPQGNSISEQRDVSSCVDTPSSTNAYAIESYHACGDSSGDLTGVWMVVADYQVTSVLGPSYEGQWRMGLRIVEEEGVLYAQSCSGYAFPNQEVVTAIEQDAMTVEFLDPMSAAKVQLDVIDALHMEGEHQSAGSLPLPINEVTVIRSSVKARKLADNADLPFGSFDIDYVIGTSQGSKDDAPVQCFVQSLGESVSPSTIVPYSETTNVLADIGTAANPIIVTSAATLAKTRPDEEEPDEDFSGVEVYLGGDTRVSSNDPDQLEIQYLGNNREGIEVITMVDDGEQPNSFANSHAVLEF